MNQNSRGRIVIDSCIICIKKIYTNLVETQNCSKPTRESKIMEKNVKSIKDPSKPLKARQKQLRINIEQYSYISHFLTVI